jgi:hypothetical protein
MAAFQTYLDAVKQSLLPGGDHRAELFNDAGVADPTDKELANFLGLLDTIIGTETKKLGGAKDAGLVGQRRDAIALLIDFALNGPATGAFAHINRNVLCFQLALRVRRPKIIDQDETTLCGPVAIVVDVAKRDPVRYVRTVIQLFKTGHANWGSVELEPGLLIRNGFKNLTPEADYIILASVRGTAAIIIQEPTLRNIFTLTKPGALCKFLTDAGYADVIDRSFLQLSTPLKVLDAITPHPLFGEAHFSMDQGVKSLRQAQLEIEGGRIVIMNAAGTLSHIVGYTQPAVAAAGPIEADATHWTLLRKLRIDPNNVFVRLVTWGGARERTLAKNVFLSYYCGYVSGTPC